MLSLLVGEKCLKTDGVLNISHMTLLFFLFWIVFLFLISLQYSAQSLNMVLPFLLSLSSSSFQRSDPPISPLLPIASVAYRDFPYYMQPSVKFIPTLGFDCFSPKNYLITKILHTKWDPASSIFFFLGENKGVREVIDTCKVILFLCYSSSEDHNQKENAMCVCTTHHHHHSYSKMPFSFFSMVRHAFHQALCKVYHTCVYLTFF